MLKKPTSPPDPSDLVSPKESLFKSDIDHSRSQSRNTVDTGSSFRRWLKRGLLLAVCVAVISVIVVIAKRTGQESDNVTQLTHTISKGDLLVTVIEQGTLESSNNVEVRSKVWGWKTVNWVIESGTEVKKGDLLVELDASEFEKKVDEAKINLHNTKADVITAESNVSVADKSIDEYLLGTFVEERTTILQEIFDAEQEVTKADLAFRSTLRLAAKGLIEQIQVDGERFKLDSVRQKLALKKTRLRALEEFKKEKQKEKLQSDLRAAEARLEASRARLDLNQTNLDQTEEQLAFHTIVAPQDGMVIHPKSAAHRSGPDVEEGANVHTNQVLLIMPDLDKMQVKLGIHESMIDRVHPGLVAKVKIGETVIDGSVSEVAKVTKPATWYTGNVVKFDTVVSIDGRKELKPGLSAAVEVIIAEHKDVLTIPVAAIVEAGASRYCWVQSLGDVQRREIQLGDSNDLFVVVESGLKEGDEVVLNPMAFVQEAQEDALKPFESDAETTDTAKRPTNKPTTAKPTTARPPTAPMEPEPESPRKN
ncbi:MAG: efflux RND transporter periplasmic adaptor subunit [Rubripirellula sp.]